ncbi:EF-hand domain-containing protein [Jannaschia sp. S6380]|uniref:EF-hand domain-containing protein n=1 Tax=Jannaschia sp. S6380 TaxID=2926408 RepID=UPI001FF3B6F7|nr:EF-hand domain-containing protein [Jannaschia sp. S6380]MCK0167008.1 EF-hand domain-containing protein [Jannaschia sp. S6380]
MNKLTTVTAALLLMGAPAFAQDADGDGNVSLEELQAAYPEVTADAFASMDTDADGVLSADELQAAIDAGMLET